MSEQKTTATQQKNGHHGKKEQKTVQMEIPELLREEEVGADEEVLVLQSPRKRIC
jgi:hypothetical protein